MRLATIIFLILLCYNGTCQKWHFNQIDSTSEFMYEYWFQFDNLEDTCSYVLEKKTGNLNSTIQLTNNFGDTMIFVLVRVKNLSNDSVTNITTDINGNIQLQLRSGYYNIEISCWSYDKLSFSFEILENEFFVLNAKLGLGPGLIVYQINSKDELKEEEIIKIMNCVKTNRQDFYENCSDKSRFYIMTQI